MRSMWWTCCVAIVGFACGENGDRAAADRGVGEACATTADCRNETRTSEDAVEPMERLECLTEFKGGYCGLKGCQRHLDCPTGSRCVLADNGSNYCFLTCVDKIDCNVHRAPEVEANCVRNAVMVDGAKDVKVCVPPSA